MAEEVQLDPISLRPIVSLAVLRPCGHRFELASAVASLRGGQQPRAACPVCGAKVLEVDATAATTAGGSIGGGSGGSGGSGDGSVEAALAQPPVRVRYGGATYLLHCTRRSTPEDPAVLLARAFGLRLSTVKLIAAGKRVAPAELAPGSSVMLVGTREEVEEGGKGEKGEGRGGGGAGAGAAAAAAAAVGVAAEAAAPLLGRLWRLWIGLVLGVLLFLRSLLPCGSRANLRAAGARGGDRLRGAAAPPGLNDARPAQREGRDGGAAAAARHAFPEMGEQGEENRGARSRFAEEEEEEEEGGKGAGSSSN